MKDRQNQYRIQRLEKYKKTSGISETSLNWPTGFSTNNVSQSNIKVNSSFTKIKRIDQNRSTSAKAFTTSLVNPRSNANTLQSDTNITSTANNVPQSNTKVNSSFTKIYEQKKKLSTGKIPQLTSTIDNIPQSNTKVNNNTSSTKYSMQDTKNDAQELDNSSFFKSKNIIPIFYIIKLEPSKFESKHIFGGGCGIRTHDPLRARQVL